MPLFTPRALSVNTPEQARAALEMIGVDPGGVGMMSGKMLHRCIHLPAMQCRQANILKQEMLSLGGEAAVARGTVACSIDRTDVVLIGTDKQLVQLCAKLKAQPFNLAALSEELEQLLNYLRQPPEKWVTSRREFLLARPLVMGILNLTPDSFSDGGRYSDPDRAVEHALRMESEGADIIDVGGESTRPGARPVSPEEESARVIPVIERLSAVLNCAISVDTWKSTVAEGALYAGAEIINDISGFKFDPLMPSVAARNRAAAVLMHTRGRPEEMQKNTAYGDLMGEVVAGLQNSITLALEAGVKSESIAVDPGIGFGKDAAGNLLILKRLSELSGLGFPVLVGTSRKSFIGKVLGRDPESERLFGTAATVALSVAGGAKILRVHDVRAMRDVADVANAILSI